MTWAYHLAEHLAFDLGNTSVPGSLSSTDLLKTENGDNLLTEDGSYLLWED